MKYFVIKSLHQVGGSFLLNLFRLEETIKQSKQTFILKMTFIILKLGKPSLKKLRFFMNLIFHKMVSCIYEIFIQIFTVN